MLDGATRGVFPKDVSLAHCLQHVVGKDAAGKLINAIAFEPCFYCEQGHSKCEECGGHGRVTGRIICGSCLGLGQASCDFCNGSGWLTINAVPNDIRLEVVIARVRWAQSAFKELMGKPLPSESSKDLGEAAGSCARLLMSLNRVIGALENAVIALNGAIRLGAGQEKVGGEVRGLCGRFGGKVDHHIRLVLQQMAKIARERWARATQEEEKRAADQRARFYESLVDSAMIRTTLEHPFLRRIMQKPESGANRP